MIREVLGFYSHPNSAYEYYFEDDKGNIIRIRPLEELYCIDPSTYDNVLQSLLKYRRMQNLGNIWEHVWDIKENLYGTHKAINKDSIHVTLTITPSKNVYKSIYKVNLDTIMKGKEESLHLTEVYVPDAYLMVKELKTTGKEYEYIPSGVSYMKPSGEYTVSNITDNFLKWLNVELPMRNIRI